MTTKKMKPFGKILIAVFAAAIIFVGIKLIPTGKKGSDTSNTLASADISLKISGSNTIGDELAPELVRQFLIGYGYKNVSVQDSAKDEKTITCTSSDGKSVVVNISAHGTKLGFESLDNGTADICMASTPSKSIGTEEHIIGLDGIAVITNKSSNVKNLTVDNLSDIFSGKISNWSQIQNSGMSGEIKVLRMDDNSGTSKMFKEMVGIAEFSSDSKQSESPKDVIEGISSTDNSIGFVSFAFLNSAIKTVPINTGLISIEPNSLSIQSEKYPFCRRLYMYKNTKSNSLATDLLKFIESQDGQKIVENSGFIDLSMNYDKLVALPNDPAEYVNLINTANKITSELRFNTGSKELDSRGIVDVDRLITFLSQPENRRKSIALVGFSDNVGDAKGNITLSKQRAEAVRQILEQKGAIVKDVYGLGQIRPARSNDTEEGKSSNRRVEIWIF
jgi:phosphate transport system substrate-binding protein